MPMPTMVNGRPVRTGSWEPAEDQALAEWQAKLGNRCALVPGRIRGAQIGGFLLEAAPKP